MDSGRLTVALAAVLGVLAVATAAAALTGYGSGGGAAGGLGAGEGDGFGSGNSSGVGLNLSGGGGEASGASELLQRAAGFLLAATIVLPIVYALVVAWQEGVRALLDVLESALRDFLVMLAVVVAFGVILWLLLEAFAMGGGGMGGTAGELGDLASGDADSDPTSTVSLAAPVVVIGIVVLFVGVVLSLTSDVSEAVARSVARVTGGEDEPDGRLDPTIHVAFADVDASNDVYRAWRAMAKSVEGRPGRTVTPAEVARRAVDSGYDERSVQELTRLFRAVRYSGETPTADREERARDALERLEDGPDDT